MGMHPYRWPSTTPLPALSDHRQSGSTAPRCMACLLGGYSCGRRTMEMPLPPGPLSAALRITRQTGYNGVAPHASALHAGPTTSLQSARRPASQGAVLLEVVGGGARHLLTSAFPSPAPPPCDTEAAATPCDMMSSRSFTKCTSQLETTANIDQCTSS